MRKYSNFNFPFITIFLLLTILVLTEGCSNSGCKAGSKPRSTVINKTTALIKITVCRKDNAVITQTVEIESNSDIIIRWPNEGERELNPVFESCGTSESMRYSTPTKEILLSASDQAVYSLCSNNEIIQKGQPCNNGATIIEQSCQ